MLRHHVLPKEGAPWGVRGIIQDVGQVLGATHISSVRIDLKVSWLSKMYFANKVTQQRNLQTRGWRPQNSASYTGQGAQPACNPQPESLNWPLVRRMKEWKRKREITIMGYIRTTKRILSFTPS